MALFIRSIVCLMLVSVTTTGWTQIPVTFGLREWLQPDTVTRNAGSTIKNGTVTKSFSYDIRLPSRADYQARLVSTATQKKFPLKRKETIHLAAGDYMLQVVVNAEGYQADTLNKTITIPARAEKVVITLASYVLQRTVNENDSSRHTRQQKFDLSVNFFLPWNPAIRVSYSKNLPYDSLIFTLTNNSDQCINGLFEPGRIEISKDGIKNHPYYASNRASTPWYTSGKGCISPGQSITLFKIPGYGPIKRHIYGTAFYSVPGEISPTGYFTDFRQVSQWRELTILEETLRMRSGADNTSPTKKPLDGIAWTYTALTIHSKTWKIRNRKA